jgi:hypothetical protein
MIWHFVNAMTFESATHRTRLVYSHQGDNFWIAERKSCCDDLPRRISGKFPTLEAARAACDLDSSASCDHAYSVASA